MRAIKKGCMQGERVARRWIDSDVQLRRGQVLLTTGSLIGSIAGAVRFTVAAESAVDADTVIALPLVTPAS